MSAVIGCTDCIVSLPVVPVSTLNLRLTLYAGQSQVLRNIDNIRLSYDASAGLVVQDFGIAAAATLTLPTGTTALVLSVSAPVTLTITKTVDSTTTIYEVTVNQFYVSDDALTAVEIANTGTTAMTGTLSYVPAAA